MRNIEGVFIAAICGGVSVVGWAPLAWWPFAVASYGALFWLIANSRTMRNAGVLGLTFGISMHWVAHGWVLHTLRTKIGIGLLPAVFETLIFVIYLALFTAVPCVLWHALVKPATPTHQAAQPATIAADNLSSMLWAIATFTSFLTLGEWMRSLFFNGFTSMSLGYSLIDTWVAGYAPVFGVYGVSWAGYGLGAIAALFLLHRPARLAFTVATSIVFSLGFALQNIEWAHGAGAPLSYRLIQSNIAQERKFDAAYVRQNIQRLVESIQSGSADLVVTPETAFPVFLNDLPAETFSQLRNFSQQSRSHVFLGIATSATNGEGYNSVIQLSPESVDIAQYNKTALMPFGEYTPWGFTWFTRTLHIPLKDLGAGLRDQQPFMAKGARIGTLICHEDLVGQEMRHWLPEATVIINPSNLAWFEGSTAIDQRLQIVRMRAVEAARPILRVTNTGITAQIAPDGKIVKHLPAATGAILAGIVQPVQGHTPYARAGNWPIVLASCALVLALAWERRRRS